MRGGLLPYPPRLARWTAVQPPSRKIEQTIAHQHPVSGGNQFVAVACRAAGAMRGVGRRDRRGGPGQFSGFAAQARAAGLRAGKRRPDQDLRFHRSEEHTSELQSLMRISYAVFCLKKKKHTNKTTT